MIKRRLLPMNEYDVERALARSTNKLVQRIENNASLLAVTREPHVATRAKKEIDNNVAELKYMRGLSEFDGAFYEKITRSQLYKKEKVKGDKK